MYEFILASQSPRRQTLFGLVQDTFLVIPASINERRKSGEDPEQYVLRLAELKAEDVASQAANIPSREVVIIAADTAVVDNGDILGKPASPGEAREILMQLRGHPHQVISGIAIHQPQKEKTVTGLVETDVVMRNYTEKEIDDYIASGDPFDKAGAYAIQNDEFQPVASYEGCFANVMGLPLCHLDILLRDLGINLPGRVPVQCQEKYNYDCQVPQRLDAENNR